MRILEVEQNTDIWLQTRMGKITGSKAKGIRPTFRDKFKKYIEFFVILAEKIAEAPDGEKPTDRGHRLEPEALAAVAERYGLTFDPKSVMWISDIDDDIAISPDGQELVTDGGLPTYAAEVKALSSAKHIKYILEDIKARSQEDYNPIYSVPNDTDDKYRDQAVQYFVVNKELETLWYIFHDDRQAMDHLVTYAIPIKREDVTELVKEQEDAEMDALVEINALVAFLSNLGDEIHVRNR